VISTIGWSIIGGITELGSDPAPAALLDAPVIPGTEAPADPRAPLGPGPGRPRFRPAESSPGRREGGSGVSGRAEQLQLDGCEPDLERLVKLAAPQRAELYAPANLDLGQREFLEIQVRTRIRADVRRQHRGGRRAAKE
jgi:hypothetical protein